MKFGTQVEKGLAEILIVVVVVLIVSIRDGWSQFWWQLLL